VRNEVYISVVLMKSNYMIIGIKRARGHVIRDSRLE
jgi:hypothetical protein